MAGNPHQPYGKIGFDPSPWMCIMMYNVYDKKETDVRDCISNINIKYLYHILTSDVIAIDIGYESSPGYGNHIDVEIDTCCSHAPGLTAVAFPSHPSSNQQQNWLVNTKLSFKSGCLSQR